MLISYWLKFPFILVLRVWINYLVNPVFLNVIQHISFITFLTAGYYIPCNLEIHRSALICYVLGIPITYFRLYIFVNYKFQKTSYCTSSQFIVLQGSRNGMIFLRELKYFQMKDQPRIRLLIF